MKPYMRRTTPVEVRLWRKVDTSAGPDECWPFTGAYRNGYGALGSGRRDEGIVYAHRVAYLDHVGPIPEGYQIDHLCRNRPCCNPQHLEAVTQLENLRRQAAALRAERVA